MLNYSSQIIHKFYEIIKKTKLQSEIIRIKFFIRKNWVKISRNYKSEQEEEEEEPELRSLSKVWMVVSCICSSTETFAAWSSTSIIFISKRKKAIESYLCKVILTEIETHRSSENAMSSCTVSIPPFSSSLLSYRERARVCDDWGFLEGKLRSRRGRLWSRDITPY